MAYVLEVISKDGKIKYINSAKSNRILSGICRTV